ncbi:MAG: DUF2975 domain-containing protein [Salinivirgaceae bacterium]|nr:DUF2975 domain-containing protein [Salinivirgaceae bacterium]
MNKKLKIYSGLFLFSILFVVVFAVFTPTDKPIVSFNYTTNSPTNYDSDVMRMSIERNANPLVTTKTDTTYQVVSDSLGNIDTVGRSINTFSLCSYRSYTVNLRKLGGTKTPPFICVANPTAKGVIDIEKAKISISSPKQNVVVIMVLCVIVALVLLIGLIWVIRLIVRVIRNIRKGNIFVSQMTVDLERLGILMTIYFVIVFIGQIYGYIMASGINIENYQVVFGPINGRAWLIAGTGLMLLSQIFSMGKDLKEDVDLTV